MFNPSKQLTMFFALLEFLHHFFEDRIPTNSKFFMMTQTSKINDTRTPPIEISGIFSNPTNEVNFKQL
jgi:hypothetical protein